MLLSPFFLLACTAAKQLLLKRSTRAVGKYCFMTFDPLSQHLAHKGLLVRRAGEAHWLPFCTNQTDAVGHSDKLHIHLIYYVLGNNEGYGDTDIGTHARCNLCVVSACYTCERLF